MRKQVIISLQPWIAEELDAAAKAAGQSRSAYITSLLLASRKGQIEISKLIEWLHKQQEGTNNG